MVGADFQGKTSWPRPRRPIRCESTRWGRGGPGRALGSAPVQCACFLGSPGHPPGQGVCPADDRTWGHSRGVAGSLVLFLLSGRPWVGVVTVHF